jgi:hypothetical protein
MSGRQDAIVLPGASQVRIKYFTISGTCISCEEKNEVTDELARLSSSWAMVPTGIFLQELHEPSISKALAKVTKVVESSKDTLPPNEGITE